MTRHGIRVRLVRNLEDYLARTAADLDQRGEVLEERRTALARLEAQLIEQEGLLAERRRRIEELSLPEETNDLVDELFKRLDDWEATTQKLRTRLAELDELCRQLQRDRAEQDARLAESERESESAREAHARAVDELEARSRELERLLDQERSRREEAEAVAHVGHPAVEIDEPGTRAAIAEERASSHLLFRQQPDGYELVPHEGPPPPVGSEIRWPDADESFIVLNVGTSPLPNDPRPCAFLQLLTRA